jgi:hypothetical protein
MPLDEREKLLKQAAETGRCIVVGQLTAHAPGCSHTAVTKARPRRVPSFTEEFEKRVNSGSPMYKGRSKGGAATVKRHGTLHMALIGKKGGQVTLSKHGTEHFRRIRLKQIEPGAESKAPPGGTLFEMEYAKRLEVLKEAGIPLDRPLLHSRPQKSESRGRSGQLKRESAGLAAMKPQVKKSDQVSTLPLQSRDATGDRRIAHSPGLDSSPLLAEYVEDGRMDRQIHSTLIEGLKAQSFDLVYLGRGVETVSTFDLELMDDAFLREFLSEDEISAIRGVVLAAHEDLAALYPGVSVEDIRRQREIDAADTIAYRKQLGLQTAVEDRLLRSMPAAAAVTERELIDVTGIARDSLRRQLRRLIESGKVVRERGFGAQGRAYGYRKT